MALPLGTLKAYKGTNKYIFISYAHNDYKVVFPIIEELQKRYNVWFDEGINLSVKFDDEIYEKILRASLVIFFLSPDSAPRESYCSKEIETAHENDIPCIYVALSEFKMPYEYRDIQYLLASNYSLSGLVEAMEEKFHYLAVLSSEKDDGDDKPLYHISNKEDVYVSPKELARFGFKMDPGLRIYSSILFIFIFALAIGIPILYAFKNGPFWDGLVKYFSITEGIISTCCLLGVLVLDVIMYIFLRLDERRSLYKLLDEQNGSTELYKDRFVYYHFHEGVMNKEEPIFYKDIDDVIETDNLIGIRYHKNEKIEKRVHKFDNVYIVKKVDKEKYKEVYDFIISLKPKKKKK